jgi:site-specific recombinase XerD
MGNPTDGGVAVTESLAVNDIAELLKGWELSLRARNRSPQTIKSYRDAAEHLREFLVRTGMPTRVDLLNREHIEAFVADQLERWRPKTAQIRYGGLLQLFKWLVEECEISASPMAHMKPPVVPEVPVPVVTDDNLRTLLATCEGKGFNERRDAAILRLLIDCGLRLAEVTNLRLEDVDDDLQTVLVLGKGRRPRAVPYGAKAAQALERYMRLRARHPLASTPALWLGPKGAITTSGVAQIVRRRCDAAGIARLHPHQFRHTAAHNWLAEGNNEGDAMRLFGWRSRQMLNRYGASAADERARDAYRRSGFGDRL